MFDVKAFIDSQRHGPYKFPYSTPCCLFCILKTGSKRWNFKYFINGWEFYLPAVIVFKATPTRTCFVWALNSFYCSVSWGKVNSLTLGSFLGRGKGVKWGTKPEVAVCNTFIILISGQRGNDSRELFFPCCRIMQIPLRCLWGVVL